MSPTPCAGQPFEIRDPSDVAVLVGAAGASRGTWSDGYPHVCPLDFGALQTPGTFTVSAMDTVSPPVQIAGASSLYGGLLANARTYFTANRDGADVVPALLDRQPSHLHDRHAAVFEQPVYDRDGRLVRMRRAGGRVDVEGGWFDAGDYVKFTGTAAFATIAMLTTLRDHPGAVVDASALRAEARQGIRWLSKMWDSRREVLYYQVGIGDGNAKVLGDHDLWRLPQRDDGYRARDRRFLAHRPVLRSAPPGGKVPPSLAGRMAAAFGLCAQTWDASPLGRRCLLAGETVFAQAKTSRVGTQVTSSPVDYYEEDEWRDDLELGALELFHALRGASSRPAGLPETRPRVYLRTAASWARAELRASRRSDDTLNLYDVAGLAHPGLVRAIDEVGGSGLAVTRAQVLAGMRRSLDPHRGRADRDPFGFGSGRWDPVPHALGLVAEGLAYDDLTHTDRYAGLAQAQLDWTFGANAWGTSFVVGAGTVFPRCLQHQIANLVGSLDGTTPSELLLGATVDGPSRVIGGPGFFEEARACPSGGQNPFAPFDQPGWRYVDRVSSWSTVEPSLDYTAMSLLALASAATEAVP
jgi:hypothetical protein